MKMTVNVSPDKKRFTKKSHGSNYLNFGYFHIKVSIKTAENVLSKIGILTLMKLWAVTIASQSMK